MIRVGLEERIAQIRACLVPLEDVGFRLAKLVVTDEDQESVRVTIRLRLEPEKEDDIL